MSGALDVRDSWSKSLEDLVAETGQKQFEGRGSLAFAPRQVRNPRAYDKTPVVLVVASAATHHLHKPLFEALELMEKASGAFKVAVFAEAGSEDVIKSFDWAAEQCFSEAAWWSMSSRNWLEMAGARLEWAQNMYGASYILAARSIVEAATELAAVGIRFGIEKLVISAAQSHVRQASKGDTESDHAWVRGWIDSIHTGESMHRIEVDPHTTVRLVVHKNDSNASLVGGKDIPDEFILEVQRRGWSVVLLESETGSMQPELELAVRRALASGLGSASAVFQYFSWSIPGWDPSLGSAAVFSSPGGAWELRADGGLSFKDATTRGIADAAERLIAASSLADIDD